MFVSLDFKEVNIFNYFNFHASFGILFNLIIKRRKQIIQMRPITKKTIDKYMYASNFVLHSPPDLVHS